MLDALAVSFQEVVHSDRAEDWSYQASALIGGSE